MLPPGSPLERTERVMEDVRAHFLVDQKDAVKSCMTVAGYSMAGRGQNTGLAFVKLKDWDLRNRPELKVDQVVKKAMGAFMGRRDALIFAFAPPAVIELGNSTGFARASRGSWRSCAANARPSVEARQRNHWALASIVGYTNAGKSTLLNTLTGAQVLAENKLFATLSPDHAPPAPANQPERAVDRHGRLYPQTAAWPGGSLQRNTRRSGPGRLLAPMSSMPAIRKPTSRFDRWMPCSRKSAPKENRL